jgi:ABC-type sugar transport system ATPase subunit
MKGTLRHLENLGADTLLYFDTEDHQQIIVRKEGMISFEKGKKLFLDYDDCNLHMFKDGKRV